MFINYQISEKGQPFILLHGWNQNLHMMKPIYDAFKDEYRICNLDLPGFGKSEEILDYENFDDYVEWFHDFICEHQLENPIILAHSFGARLAIRYAYQYPVAILILTGAAGIASKLTMKQKLNQLQHKIEKKMHIQKARGSYDYQMANPFQRKVLVHVVNDDLTKLLPSLKQPMLLIWGSEDEMTPQWMGEKMADLCEKATLIILKNDDHFAYYHQIQRFIFIVRSFLEGSVECN